MATYAYLPVPTNEMRDFALRLRLPPQNILSNRFIKGYGKALARMADGCLGKLTADDRLLLVCHGLERGSKTTGADRGDKQHPDWKVYTPAHLARAIEKEGLTKSFVDLRLLVCGSALPPEGEAPFAKRLCDELTQRGYANILVTGYKGKVSTDNGKIEVARNGPQGGRYYDADDRDSYAVYPYDAPVRRASIVVE